MENKDGEAMEARLAEMGKRIDELKSRLGTVTGEVKTELERRIDAAYAAQEEQRQRLHRLKDKEKVWSSGTALRTRPAAAVAWSGALVDKTRGVPG